MRNESLAMAMRQAGVSQVRLAAEIGVDPKTVERWITSGRVPHRRHRDAVAERLLRAPSSLWDVPDEHHDGIPAEVVAMYPSRRSIPHSIWQGLMAGVTARFELHALAALFLPDQTMDLARELKSLADHGASVRLLLADPEGTAITRRDDEEGRVGIEGRVRLVLGYLTPAIQDPRIDVRLHDTTLYVSTYRFDDDLLVNQHIWGAPAGANPVQHLRGPDTAPLISAYQSGFERVWAAAKPLTTWSSPMGQ